MGNLKRNITQDEYDQFVDLLKNHTKDEVAKMLGVTRKTIYNYIAELGIELTPVSKLKEKLAKIKK